MIEKVNPMHPDKIADRIAGALVDMAYKVSKRPKIAVEVLIGHDQCTIITETTVKLPYDEVLKAVWRVCGHPVRVYYNENEQDTHLTENQADGIRCGDNGIFKGMPLTIEQRVCSTIAQDIFGKFPTDGKYILDGTHFIACQSNADKHAVESVLMSYRGIKTITVNPLGYWTGGINVDTGATNRKLGSDMADSITGGGLHGKDLSKADVSVNIYAWLKAQKIGQPVELCCAIGDDQVDGKSYSEIVSIAEAYIKSRGGFEKFAEWGLF